MRTSSLLISGAVAAVAVAGSASASVATFSFATAPALGTYDSATGTLGGASSAWLANGWAAGQGAWRLSSPTPGPSQAVFSTQSLLPFPTTLANTYATGVARYAPDSNIPALGQAMMPVFAFSVSIASANDAQITVGLYNTGAGSSGMGIFQLPGSSGASVYADAQGRQAFGFHFGWNTPNIYVQVNGNRAGLSGTAATAGNMNTTWSQLMATSTGLGGTWGNLAVTAVSIFNFGHAGTFDSATVGNPSVSLIQQFSMIPAPSAVALLGAAGLVGSRRRRG
jgi:hypothetical protein